MRAAPLLPLLAVACGRGDVVPADVAPLQRLTPTEYRHTIRDLFAVEEFDVDPDPEEPIVEDDEDEPAVVLPPDRPVEGFEGLAEGQTASPYLVEQLQRAAARHAPLALQSPVFFVCDDIHALGDDDDAERACARDSVLRFAQRAWRRPLTDAERTRLLAFWEANAAASGVFDGIRLTVEGLLQSPQFLYRLADPGAPAANGPEGAVPLSPFELASRLSYFLWDSMPDARLFEAAAKGQLETPAQVRAQARRMLEDPRARQAVARFHHQWLDLDRIHTARADLGQYGRRYAGGLLSEVEEDGLQEEEELWSAFLIGSRNAGVREAEQFVVSTLFDRGGTFADLLTSTEGYASRIDFDLDEPLGTDRLYGLSEDALGEPIEQRILDDGNFEYRITLHEASWPEDERAGVLTLPAWLGGFSHPVHPAPILRGTFVLERLLCQPIGQPPPEAAGQSPPDAALADGTNRARVEAITADAPCSACHDRINPTGFAFEAYDSVGGFRTEDNGLPVDTRGVLSLGQAGELRFADAVELSRQLATHPLALDCYAETWLRYALGAAPPLDHPRVVEIRDRFRQDGDVLALLEDLVASDLFRFRPTGGAQ